MDGDKRRDDGADDDDGQVTEAGAAGENVDAAQAAHGLEKTLPSSMCLWLPMLDGDLQSTIDKKKMLDGDLQ